MELQDIVTESQVLTSQLISSSLRKHKDTQEAMKHIVDWLSLHTGVSFATFALFSLSVLAAQRTRGSQENAMSLEQQLQQEFSGVEPDELSNEEIASFMRRMEESDAKLKSYYKSMDRSCGSKRTLTRLELLTVTFTDIVSLQERDEAMQEVIRGLQETLKEARQTIEDLKHS